MRVEFWQPMRIPTVTHNDLEIHTRKKGGKRIPFIGKSSELLDAAYWADTEGIRVDLREVER